MESLVVAAVLEATTSQVGCAYVGGINTIGHTQPFYSQRTPSVLYGWRPTLVSNIHGLVSHGGARIQIAVLSVQRTPLGGNGARYAHHSSANTL